ncbi:hypothetical protein [Falsiroseomonas sp. HW251]|uniref:hypothetical protein n=1 Tax=Falsiroseomonas sp. HW251 TaxID=3390998 RepID=UPI003D31996A
MTPALARRLGKALPLLGSPEHGEALAAARAVGRILAAAGMDWHAFAAMVAAETQRQDTPAFTFATASRRAARKVMAHLARQPGTSPADMARLERLRARLLGAKKLTLSAEEIGWLDALWRADNGTGEPA